MKRKIVLVAALAAGVLAAVLSRFYLSAREAELLSAQRALASRYGTMDVLVFRADIPGGTVLSRGDLGEMSVPALGLRGQALTRENLAEVIGRRLVLGHRRGEVLFWSDVEGGNPHEQGLSSDIKRQMRAISINVNGSASVSGMVRPNDRVDVIGTFSFPRAGASSSRDAELVTCTILQNVLVLATGQETAKSAVEGYRPDRGYSLVTLEVSPREAEMIAFAEQMKGRLVLTLRNRTDTSYERELPEVDFAKIKGEMETLNLKRQQKLGGR